VYPNFERTLLCLQQFFWPEESVRAIGLVATPPLIFCVFKKINFQLLAFRRWSQLFAGFFVAIYADSMPPLG
jgi:hypothetical protein